MRARYINIEQEKVRESKRELSIARYIVGEEDTKEKELIG